MKISISVTNYSWPGGRERLSQQLLDVARRADVAGIDTLWVADHLLQMDPTARVEEPMLEAYTTLGFLGAATQRLRLGTMVTWASIRPPALLIKTVTTLDVLTGARAWLGIGAGYQGDEAAMMGLPFPPTAERFERMEEILQLADHMWNGDETPFHGPHHQLERPLNSPAPLSRPRILIGGAGERRTLPLVARYADACNLFDIPDGGATLRRKLDVLGRACDAVGRNRDDVEVTLSSRISPGESPDEFVARCLAFRAQGIDHVVLVRSGPWTNEALDVVVEAIAIMAARA
jgi:F420-dependent oxidoreductase-like protein